MVARYREQQGGGEVQIADRDRLEQFLNARGTERASGTERDRLFEACGTNCAIAADLQ